MSLLHQVQQLEGGIQHGHFALTSGRHSDQYINKDALFRSPLFNSIIFQLADVCHSFPINSTTIITGPAVAGAILAAPVWFHLYRRYHPTELGFVYSEKINGRLVFHRGYDRHLQGKQVVIIEDIITTGGSVSSIATLITKYGGTVIGCACIWNRLGWNPFDFSTKALINEMVDSWTPEECPLCKNNIPLTSPKLNI